MTTGPILLGILALAIAGIALLRVLGRKAAPPPDPVSGQVRKTEAALKRPPEAPRGPLDAVDTPPDGATLADLLAARTGPLVPPEALVRRAERLQARHSSERNPALMRALAKLLIDTVDCGLPDATRFHDAARIFLATAGAEVLAEFAPEAEARFDALTPWFENDLSVAALRSTAARVPGPLDPLLAQVEQWREAMHVAKVDALLAGIGQAADAGLPAAGDALLLARHACKRPRLMQRAVAEMAMHPESPTWISAWLMLEGRALEAGELSNPTAFRSRVMRSLRSEDPILAAAAGDAVGQLLDADCAGDISVLVGAVNGALMRFETPPRPITDLAARLGIATDPDAA
jgi:hypothetical protein